MSAQRKGMKAGLVLAVILCAYPVGAQESLPEQPLAEQPVIDQAVDVAPPTPEQGALTPPGIEASAAALVSPAQPAAVPPASTFSLNPNSIGPMLFTFWEQSAINEALVARNLPGATKRAPEGEPVGEVAKPPPEEREIKLSGILFVSSSDWIVWLNGKRVTPKAIPKEVLDMKVYERYVEIRWFDEYTNQVFPIRLRPHERFNIDSRVFIPG